MLNTDLYQSQPVTIAGAGPQPVAPTYGEEDDLQDVPTITAPPSTPQNIAEDAYADKQQKTPPPEALRSVLKYLSDAWDDLSSGVASVPAKIGEWATANPEPAQSVDSIKSQNLQTVLNKIPKDISDEKTYRGRTLANIFNLESLFSEFGFDAANKEIEKLKATNPFDYTVQKAYIDGYYNNNFDRQAASAAALKASQEARSQELKILADEVETKRLINLEEELTDKYRGEAKQRALKKMREDTALGRVGITAADGTKVPASQQQIVAAADIIEQAIATGNVDAARAQLLGQGLGDFARYLDSATSYFDNKQMLIRQRIGGQKAEIGTQTFQDKNTGELYNLRKRGSIVDYVGPGGKVYRGSTANLRAYGIGSDIETKNILQRQELQNKLAFAAPTKRAEIVAENEAKYGKLPEQVRAAALAGQPLPEIVGAVPTPQEAVQTTPAAATPVRSAAPAVQTQIAPATAPTAPAAPVPSPVPVARPTAAPATTLAGRETAEALRKRQGELLAEDLAKTQIDYNKVKDNATYLISKVRELTTHPGFKFSVGLPDIGENTLGLGIPIPFGAKIAGAIPGTDVNDWRARFKEIDGAAFLQAFETLKGGGAITETEGIKATQAINRMKESQSEEEFKAAAKDFIGIIERGVARSQKKLGITPEQPRAQSKGVTSSGNSYKKVQ